MINLSWNSGKLKQSCSWKDNVLENLAQFRGKTCAGVCFLIKFQTAVLQLYLKKTPAQAVSYEFCETFKNTFLTEKLRNTVSVNGTAELCGIFGKILCERYHLNQTQILFDLSWWAAHSIIAMFLRKFPRKVIASHSLIGIWWDFTYF